MTDSRARATLLVHLQPSSTNLDGQYRVQITNDEDETFTGDATIDTSALNALEADAWAYGTLLGRSLFAHPTLQRALGQARGSGHRVSMALQVDAPSLQDVIWERVFDSNLDELAPIACSSKFSLTRHIPRSDTRLPARKGAFRLLLVLSSPKELQVDDSKLPALNLAEEIRGLHDAWLGQVERGLMRVAILARVEPALAQELTAGGYTVYNEPATLDAIADKISSFDSLHLIAHGKFKPADATKEGRASLLLENPDGGAAIADEADFIGRLGDGQLRLVFLQACQSAAREPGRPNVMSGLAPKLAHRAAAVVAMQDFVRVDDARRFAGEFYDTLLSTGRVDYAANEGRRVLLRKSVGNWAIPALYLSPRAAELWEPDVVLRAVQDLAEAFRRRAEVEKPFPIEVIRKLPDVSSKMETSPPGPRARVPDAVRAALNPEQGKRSPIVVLAGNRGRAKTTQLWSLYLDYASKLARGESPLPLFAQISAFHEADESAATIVAQAIAESYKAWNVDLPAAAVNDRLSQPFVLFVDGDERADGRQRKIAFQALQELTEGRTDAAAVVTLDEDFVASTVTHESGQPTVPVLIVQLLSPATVAQYLCGRGDEGHALLGAIRAANLFDLASVPWLLGYLLRRGRRGNLSRSSVITRVVQDNLSGASLSLPVQRLLPDVLGRIAWSLQTHGGATRLDGAHLYELLDQVRGRREVSLDQLKTAALDTKILSPSDDEGVRFSYPGFQSYWCAHYLIHNPHGAAARLDDITSTLGRRSRVRLWEDTLVLLAGMSSDPESLVRHILEGSGLSHGEHAFLAARCINETKLTGRSRIPDYLESQVLDSLVWRSTPMKESSASVRVQATECLGLLNHPGSIPHLVSLAVERVRPDLNGQPQFELSGLRHAALQVLLLMYEQTEAHLASRAASTRATAQTHALRDLISCWRKGDSGRLRELFSTEVDGIPAVVAFALGTLGGADNRDFLTERILGKAERDTQWSIADALLLFDPVEVSDHAVARMRDTADLHPHAAYMIGKLRLATQGCADVAFLEACLHSGNVTAAGMALRALAQLAVGDYRDVCEAIATGDWAKVKRARTVAVPKRSGSRVTLRQSAIESLRLIGNAESCNALRRARSSRSRRGALDRHTLELMQLSYEVSEDIFWRLSANPGDGAANTPQGWRSKSS